MSKKRTGELLARIMSHGSDASSYPKFKYAKEKLMTDRTYPNMYRVRWRDGTLSDLLNLSRANYAIKEAACAV